MKIESFDFKLENLRLSKPYRIAFKTVDFVENLFVEIPFDNGVVGYGACNPENEVAFISRQKTLQAIDLLDEDKLKSLDMDHPSDIIREINKMVGDIPTFQTALEMAIWDGWAKSQDKPLLDLWGKKKDPLPTSVTIGIMDVHETMAEAEEFIKNGFNHLKIKIGLDPIQDVERIIRLREKYKETIIIRADINQGYRIDDFKKFLTLSSELQIELYEQPLRTDQFHDLDTLPPEQRKWIAADESLLQIEDAQKLAETQRCGIFNIKLMKCGGWSKVEAISDLAASANIDLMWGCNDESRTSIAAALHMAYSCEHTKYLDLDGSFDLAYDPARGGFRVENGMMIPLDKPGLGITLDF